MGRKQSKPTDRTRRTARIDGCKVELTPITERPLVLTGFPWYPKEQQFCRLPVDSIEKMERIRGGAWSAAGAMVRFKTDSDVVAVRVKLRGVGDMSHMPRTGNSGVDLFVGRGTGKVFEAGTRPPAGVKGYDAILARFPDRRMRECTLNLPLYNGITKMSVGVSPGSRLARPSPFAVKKPVLFYGGSITQGGCASRPGNACSHIVCRWLDANMVNLGFSGCSKLEPVMAELIASLDLSVLAIDPTNTSLEELRDRHEPFFRIIRDKRPGLPVVFGTRADCLRNKDLHRARRAVIRRTYRNAVRRGDRRVFYLDGTKVFGKRYYDCCTVDGVHPGDLGFMQMAEAYYPLVRKALRVGKR